MSTLTKYLSRVEIMVSTDMIPCSLVNRHQQFLKKLAASVFSAQDYPQDGGNSLLRNIGTYLPSCTVLHSIRLLP